MNHHPTSGDLPPDTELRAGLHRLTAGSAPDADWPDLIGRIEQRHRRRSRTMAGLAAVVALATGVGGFAIGNQDSAVHLSSGAARREAAQDRGPASTIPPGSMESQASAGDAGSFVPGFSGSPSVASLATPLIARETDGGLGLRVTRLDFAPDMNESGGYPGTVLPDECITVGSLNIGVVLPTDFAVTSGQVTRSRQPRAALSATVASTGESVIVVVVTGAGNAEVRGAFPGGANDSMNAKDGIAVLAATVTQEQLHDWREVKVSVGDGGAAKQLELTANGYMYFGSSPDVVEIGSADMPPQPDCSPRLPAPGEQPADAAAAKAAVAKSFSTLYVFTTPTEERARLIDDTTGVEAALAQVLSGSLAEAAKGARWKLVDMVFTDPTTAVVKYDIEIPEGSGSQSIAQNRFGTAKLVDGTWKVARATICADLALAGGMCDQDPHGTAESGSAVPTTIGSSPVSSR